MSTEPAAAEGHPGPADTDAPRAGQGAEATGPEETAAEEGAGTPDPAETDDGTDDGAGVAAEPAAEGEGVSEAAAEIAAQRELQERIAQRKAAKEGPVAAGGKLSGTAADLLAAVRAVESGERPAAVFGEPAPAPRKVVAEPVRRAPAAAPAGPAEPAAEAVDAVRAL
ncbi:DNA helicase RecD, partial [Streptomyces sp. NPDC056983]